MNGRTITEAQMRELAWKLLGPVKREMVTVQVGRRRAWVKARAGAGDSGPLLLLLSRSELMLLARFHCLV